MASVWVHDRKRARKLKGRMSQYDAERHFKAMVREWCERGGRATVLSGMEALMYDPAGSLICGLYVEPYSPPSAAEPGQPKRQAA